MKPNIHQELETAVQVHISGRLADAEKLYLAVLEKEPHNFHATHLLGLLAHQTGNNIDAERLITKAISIDPNHPEANFNFGNVLHKLGRIQDAARSYQTAISCSPQYLQAHYNLGNVFRELGRPDDAIASYLTALNIEPRHVSAHMNLGNEYKLLGNYDRATEQYILAIELSPNLAEAYVNLGTTFQAMNRFDEAIEQFVMAIKEKPDYGEAYFSLGNLHLASDNVDKAISNYKKAIPLLPGNAEVLNNLGDAYSKNDLLEDAVTFFLEALAINPNFDNANYNLGNALKELGRLDEAVTRYHDALTINPDFAEAHNNLGNAFGDLGQLGEAVEQCRNALAISPESATAHNNLAGALKGMGKLDEAIASFRTALTIKPDFTVAHSNLLLTLNYGADVNEYEFFELACNWDKRHASVLAQMQEYSSNVSPDRRLRIGYVSPDMRRHSVAYFLEPLLAAHDSRAVEIFCYADVAAPDATTHRMEELADHWRWTWEMTDEALAQAIRDDDIDILVDLAGHTSNNRLLVFVRRPAPIQVNWLGYPNTTGLEAMDYRIVDEVTDPGNEASETLVRLENGFLCYMPPESAPPIPSPHTTSTVTFGSFNNITKMSTPCIALWSRIMTEVPDARLLLKSIQLADSTTCDLHRESFAAHGIDPARIELQGQTPSLASHFGLYADVDVCLDPYPYNGTTTTCEALWMGIPVVTLLGEHHRSRVGASLLTRVGLDDCVAIDADAYVARAVELALDPTRRMALRTQLREKMAPLCDADTFARDMEGAYRSMWKERCASYSSQLVDVSE